MVSSNCIRRGTFERRAQGCDCPVNIHAICPYTKACNNGDWYLAQVLKALQKSKEDK